MALIKRKRRGIDGERSSGPQGHASATPFGPHTKIPHILKGSDIKDERSVPPKSSLAIALNVARMSRKKDKLHRMAEGGQVKGADETQIPKSMSLAQSIYDAKRKKEQVDLDLNAEEIQPHNYDEQNELAAEDDLYDLDQVSDQPSDSNMKDEELEDEDSHGRDLISAIRRKMKKSV